VEGAATQGKMMSRNLLDSAALFLMGAVTAISLASATSATAQAFPPKGKPITMLIGSESGGGTDASGRLIARFIGKYLPSAPSVVVQNMPGAGGLTALNHVILKTQPDGLLLVMGSASTVDPLTFRKGNSKYDPTKFRIVGGIGRGGTVLIINSDAEKRLYDKSASPVVMGSNAAIPRQGMQVAVWGVEYLGWNMKWVTGYPGTNELMLALDRDEIDMTSTGNIFSVADRLKGSKLKIINQSGMIENGKIIGRDDFGKAPLFTDQMRDKIKDPTAQKSFEYWLAMNTADKWLALAPDTPDDILEIYRQAFTKMAADPEFLSNGEKISDGFFPMTYKDVEDYIRTLANTPDEAVEYTTSMMRKQGIQVQ
jgi:tripartite-type tricarboxylate transporter receptor subunit TctC